MSASDPAPTRPPSLALALVTGATGLLGSHIAQQLRSRGVAVRALVRPTSRVEFLRSIGAETVVGDLTAAADCDRALDGVGHVFHAASKVGDWGRWPEFERDCLQATATLGAAAARAGVARFVHISSTSAYGHPREGGPPITEDAPLGQNFWPVWDDYTRSKVEQERIVWGLGESHGLRMAIIRPSWLYGERDRTTTARIVDRMRRGVTLIGRGDNPLSAIYAGEVAAAAILAATQPQALGQAYNVTDLGPITQRAFFTEWCRACQGPDHVRRFGYDLVFAAALGFEAWGRLLRRQRPPLITRYATWLMGRNVAYSSAKAREQLGWTPGITYAASIERTVRWYLDQARTGGTPG